MLVWLIASIVLTVLLGILVIIGATFYKKDEGYYYEGENMMIGGGIPLFFALASLIASSIMYPIYKHSYFEHKTDIMSLKNTTEIEGSFCLGSGHVESCTYHYFYYKTDKGVIRGKVNSNYTYLVEDDSKTPSLWKGKDKNSLNDYYVIYIPTDTIILNYNIE